MYAKGHIGIALLLFSPILALLLYLDELVVAALGLILVIGLATLPDSDLKTPGLRHRGITHSIFGGVVVGGVLASVAFFLPEYLPIEYNQVKFSLAAFSFGVLAIIFHLCGDWLTPSGIQPGAPVSSKRYSAGVVSSQNPLANILLYLIGLAVVGVVVFLVLFQ